MPRMIKTALITCIDCNAERLVNTSKYNLEKYRIEHPRCHPCSMRSAYHPTQYKKGDNSNEKSNNWKGNNAKYSARHSWVHRRLGKASKCSHCHIKGLKRYVWANKSYEYKRDVTDWIELCPKCHYRMDKVNNWGAATALFPEIRRV